MELSNTLELLQTYGITPILCIIIYVLYRQVQKHEGKIETLQQLIIKEIKNNAIELKAIHDTTIIAINHLTDTFDKFVRNNDKFKHYD